jgi:repressor LexA
LSKPISELKDRLKTALTLRDIRPIVLAEKTGIPKSAISQYMSGYTKPKQDRIYSISRVLNVSEAWLMGFDVPMERTPSRAENDIDYSKFDNIIPITTKKFPLLGKIACGEPIFADEDRESYIAADSDIKADFVLRCKGDSMVGARIMDGDLVFIRKQISVENGEIAAVIIDDSATLKRVYYYKEKNTLILKPENPRYEDFIYTGNELDNIRILGKAIAFQSDVR